MLVLRFFVRETRMYHFQVSPAALWYELDCNHCLRASSPCGSRDPGDFHEAISFQSKKPSMVWMMLPFELSFPKERLVDSGLHQDCSRHREPAIHLFRP